MHSRRGKAVKARLLFSPVAWLRSLLFVLLGLPTAALAVDLSAEERAWLDAHPVIRVGVDVDWAPVEYVDQDGRFLGISADYLALLQQQLGVRFTPAIELNWQDTLAAIKHGELDMLSSVKRTQERETYLAFTDTYVSMPIMIFAGPEVSYIGNLQALDGHKVAVVNGYAIHELLASNHPGIQLVPVKNAAEALRRVASGEVRAFVGNVLTTSYYLSKLGFTQIKVAGETPYANDQAMAVPRQQVILAGILNKALRAIPPAEQNAIYQRWLAIRYEQAVVYSALWKYLLGALLVLVLILIWNRTLRHQVGRRTAQFHDELSRRERSEQRFLMLFDNAPDAIVVLDAESGRVVAANHNAERLFGMSHEQLLSASPWDLSPAQQPDGRPSKDQALERIGQALQGQEVVFEWTHQAVDGRQIPCEVRLVGLPSTEGRQVQGSIIDITARKRAEADMQLAAGVFDNTSEGIFVTDANARILRVNQAFTDITGYSSEEVLGQTPSLLRSGRYDEHFYRAFWQTLHDTGYWQGEISNRKKNGELFPAWQNVSAVRDHTGKPVQYISIFSDISEKKMSEARLQKLAHYDVLTGLPNRLLFNERLEHALVRVRRTKTQLALLFLDLDHFKDINDSLGHPVGDGLLRQVADRLRATLREQDTVARLGGDEFCVILEELRSVEDAAHIASKLVRAMQHPFQVDDHVLTITTSIGISLDHQDAVDPATLVKNADSAMYHAKQAGRDQYQFYSPELTTAALERVTLGSELRRALEEDELEVWYQPQWRLGNGSFFAAEALLRWRHPQHGLIPPCRFIPIAEEQGLIGAIGEMVLETACAQMRAWLDQGLVLDNVAVNVSGQQVRKGDIVAIVQRVLQANRLAPSQLELEITESSIMERTDRTMALMDGLKSLGVTISVDDFGTGYSSLSYLKRLPIDKLKIDRSFVMDIPQDSSDMAIVRAIIALGRSLNLTVLAEGVETEQQQAFLAVEGCDEAQGFLIGKPMPAAEFEALLRLNIRMVAGG